MLGNSPLPWIFSGTFAQGACPTYHFVGPPSTVLSELVLNHWFSARHHLQTHPGLSKAPVCQSAISAPAVLGTIWVPRSPAVNSYGHLLLRHHMQPWSAFHSDVRSHCHCGRATFEEEVMDLIKPTDRAAKAEQLLVPQGLISESHTDGKNFMLSRDWAVPVPQNREVSHKPIYFWQIPTASKESNQL